MCKLPVYKYKCTFKENVAASYRTPQPIYRTHGDSRIRSSEGLISQNMSKLYQVQSMFFLLSERPWAYSCFFSAQFSLYQSNVYHPNPSPIDIFLLKTIYFTHGMLSWPSRERSPLSKARPPRYILKRAAVRIQPPTRWAGRVPNCGKIEPVT